MSSNRRFPPRNPNRESNFFTNRPDDNKDSKFYPKQPPPEQPKYPLGPENRSPSTRGGWEEKKKNV